MKEWKQLWIKPRPITDPEGHYNGFNPSVTVLPAGYQDEKGDVALTCDVIWERDDKVVLRDGTAIYTDIYRPVTQEKVPAVISWSPYGKSNIDVSWAYNEKDLSHLQKEEGVDPALWCAAGYAVAHPDARGAYMSEGNIFHWGEPEGKDIYDYVEWLAAQDWCDGNVGMAGNSYLTIAQWFAADQKPPHLKAIAPWEGQTDAYRETILQGGIANVAFPRQAVSVMHGNNYVDDMPSMAEKYPLMNDYWEDKRAVLKDITIPAYIVASYTNPIHTHGTFRAYREISSKKKWLRVHNSHEWVDFYKSENQKELLSFFDRYLKGIENDWEKTPKVRYAVLNPGGVDETNLVSEVFPPENVQYTKIYLSGSNGKLLPEPGENGEVSYDGKDPEAGVEFRITFEKETCIIGYPKVKFFVETKNCHDMDLFVEISKENKEGELTAWDCTPHNRYQEPLAGFEGKLRVSLRELNLELSSDLIPVHSFREPDYLNDGEIAEVEIGIRPIGLKWEAGETLVLRIGNEYRENLEKGIHLGTANNMGEHIIHCGGDKASYIQLPFLKEKK
ncbi:MAG: CocE/NonD family hydrolase [Lachnospiraceae bacterium]|nr:CocE/NonD family hydrolase [Lachnospiraceae bacterium]